MPRSIQRAYPPDTDPGPDETTGAGRPLGLPRLTNRAFTDLAVYTIGFGLVVGAVFPFFIIPLGMPAAQSLRPVFFAATIGAGFIVCGLNFALARAVVGIRLRLVAGRMAYVRRSLQQAADLGDWSSCDPDTCQLPVDSADELGEVAESFNRLVVALASSQSVERAFTAVSAALVGKVELSALGQAALDQVMAHSKATGSAMAVLLDGRMSMVAEAGRVPAGWTVEDMAQHAIGALHLIDLPLDAGPAQASDGASAVLLPLRVAGTISGFVAVFADEAQPPAVRRLLTLLVEHLGMALQAALLHGQLTHEAFHDTLTRLANRALFLDRLQHALGRRRPAADGAAVIFVDLDDFKSINDGLGHAAGDELLVIVADRIRSCLRPADTAARLGGDEFGVLVDDVTQAGLGEIAARLLDTLGRPVTLSGRSVRLTASVGVAVLDGGADADEVLRNADAAMYEAKNHGKGRLQLFDPKMHEAAVSRLERKADLARALEADELSLVYQPIVDLSRHRIVGVEALLRWQHPRHGPVPPAEFLPVAEESGLIEDIGRWVLQQACDQAGFWQLRYPQLPLSLGVKVSEAQLHGAALASDITEALQRSGLEAGALVLEVAEPALRRDSASMLAFLARIRQLGVHVALDGFGAGHSSLVGLPRLPVDLIRVDPAITGQLDGDERDSKVARAVFGLACTLGVPAVADGVLTAAQQRALTALGCDLGQGAWLGVPLPVRQMEELLAQHVTTHDRESLPT